MYTNSFPLFFFFVPIFSPHNFDETSSNRFSHIFYFCSFGIFLWFDIWKEAKNVFSSYFFFFTYRQISNKQLIIPKNCLIFLSNDDGTCKNCMTKKKKKDRVYNLFFFCHFFLIIYFFIYFCFFSNNCTFNFIILWYRPVKGVSTLR